MYAKAETLLSGTIKGNYWSIIVKILENGTFYTKGTGFSIRGKYRGDKNKNAIRLKDNSWCYRNIPSSIMWNVEIHHNWNDGGRMYLLSKKEHVLAGRKEND